MPEIHGEVAKGFEPVRDAFALNFENHEEVGAAFALYVKGEKVVAHTKNGTVHSVTDFHASKRKEEEDTQLVEENPEQTGANYVKAQQGLPDVIVVDGSGGGPAPSGAEP